jgi:hypothetical protein
MKYYLTKQKKIYPERTAKQYLYNNKCFRQNWRLQHGNDPIHTSHTKKQFTSNNIPQLLERASYREYLIDVKRNAGKENSKISMN